jgi:hypothetical protein
VALSGDEDTVVIHVRDGEIADAGSWVYTWLRVGGDRRVVYVGATGLQPETRAWLHLHDPNPDVGRIAARYPMVAEERLEVFAIRLPEGISRQETKLALTAGLAEAELLSERYVGDSPIDIAATGPDVAQHVERLVSLVRRHVAD